MLYYNLKTELDLYVGKGLLISQIHPTLPLTIYNYSDRVQWENLWDDITLSARGLIVDDNGIIVAKPFKKFFNLSENKTNITSDYEIFEKLDGSLGILFNYKNQWVFASRGSFTSDQAIKGKEILDNICDYSLLNENYTYCFEIIYRENKIVVDYKGMESCILTAAFETLSGFEIDLSTVNYPYIVKKLNFDTPLTELHNLISDNEEGYVIRFSNGERCKIKGSEYLRLHKIMTEISTTRIWESLKDGEDIMDLLVDFPDEFFNLVKNYIDELNNIFNDTKEIILNQYNESMKDYIDDKTYALSITNNQYKHFLFRLKNNKDIDESIWKLIKPKYSRL